jgi:hypothetical protein
MRRCPPPWTVEKIPGGFKVLDANGQSLAYVYLRETKANADTANVLHHGRGAAIHGKHRQAAKATRKGLIEKYTYGGAAIQCALSVGSDSASLPR